MANIFKAKGYVKETGGIVRENIQAKNFGEAMKIAKVWCEDNALVLDGIWRDENQLPRDSEGRPVVQ